MHHREKKRATEARVKQNSSLLGRILYSMGAPIGKKNQEKEIRLPSYLKNPLCPRKVKKDFVEIYLMNRGTYDRQKKYTKIQGREKQKIPKTTQKPTKNHPKEISEFKRQKHLHKKLQNTKNLE